MKIKLPDNERALWLLKTKGSQPLNILAKELNVTTEGARFQLLKLANEGLVSFTSESKGRGRPQQIWSLTPVGQSRFPDTHADLTVKLITMTRQILGEDALQAVIDANSQESLKKYATALADADNLQEKVSILAEIRNSEGYMASCLKDDQGLILVENHCPICTAAAACQGFCKSELDTFRTVLGDNVKVERIDHILQGARRCAYRIME